jgi:hypothetical protein
MPLAQATPINLGTIILDDTDEEAEEEVKPLIANRVEKAEVSRLSPLFLAAFWLHLTSFLVIRFASTNMLASLLPNNRMSKVERMRVNLSLLPLLKQQLPLLPLEHLSHKSIDSLRPLQLKNKNNSHIFYFPSIPNSMFSPPIPLRSSNSIFSLLSSSPTIDFLTTPITSDATSLTMPTISCHVSKKLTSREDRSWEVLTDSIGTGLRKGSRFG